MKHHPELSNVKVKFSNFQSILVLFWLISQKADLFQSVGTMQQTQQEIFFVIAGAK